MEGEQTPEGFLNLARAKLNRSLKSMRKWVFGYATDFNQLNARPTQKTGFVDGPEGPSFHIFTQLPSEIRLAIWRLVLPPPRLICSVSDEEDYHDIIHYSPWSRLSDMYKSKRRKASPDKQARRRFYGVFHACQESRSEAFNFYTILAPNPEAMVMFELPKWAPLYVNIYHDIFVVPQPWPETDRLPRQLHELLITYGEQLEMLRTIATSEIIVRGRDRGEAAYNTLHRLFPNATTLILLYPYGKPLNADGVYCPSYEGHGEAVNKEYQMIRAVHPEWNIRSVEVKRYDNTPLPTVPLPVGKKIDLDATYSRKLAIRRRRGAII